MMQFNPFLNYSIAEYHQYKESPLVDIRNVSSIKSTVGGQIRDGFRYPERLLILGQRGLGKTSSLFFIKELLDKSEISNIILSRLPEDAEHFRILAGESIEKLFNKKIVLLIDFPDTLEIPSFKKFLYFIWFLMTCKNYHNINIIITLNINLYDLSLSYSEVLGKFHRIRLNPLDIGETKKVIDSRLKKGGDVEFFDDDVKKLIYEYSKGILRNIIYASRDLTDYYIEKKQVTKKMAEYLLREEYFTQIIYDRVEDEIDRKIFIDIINIIKTKYNGKIERQQDLVDTIKKEMLIGGNKCLFYIGELRKFGLIITARGGHSKNRKVIMLR